MNERFLSLVVLLCTNLWHGGRRRVFVGPTISLVFGPREVSLRMYYIVHTPNCALADVPHGRVCPVLAVAVFFFLYAHGRSHTPHGR